MNQATEARALFLQIAEQIENDILSGSHPEGSRVPSTNEFAAFLRINPATAGKGVNLLVDRGILEKRRGIGMFVAEGARARIMADRREGFREQFVLPLLTEADKLGIPADQIIQMLKGQR
jgi:GntR family transcriptional regulator